MKRRADTLVEVIIAMMVFGIIMSGTFDFIANQTIAMVKMRERDDIDFWAQKWLNTSYDVFTSTNIPNTIESEKVKINVYKDASGTTQANSSADAKLLVISKGSTTIKYTLK